MQVVGSYGVRIRDDYDALKKQQISFRMPFPILFALHLKIGKPCVKQIPCKGVRECLNA